MILFLSTLFSILYHGTHETKFLHWDMFFAYANILANFLIVCVIRNGYAMVGATIALTSLYFYDDPFHDYYVSHTIWHFWIALANTFFIYGLLKFR